MTRARTSRSRRRVGFTLIELIAVMMMLGLLSATVAPALSAIQRARDNGLAREIARRLETARAFAMATGQPAGVNFDLNAGVIGMRRIAATGQPPSPTPGPTGEPTPDLVIKAMYPGSRITRTRGLRVPNIWFNADGAPQTRRSDGSFKALPRIVAQVESSGSHIVLVWQTTGLVEKSQ